MNITLLTDGTISTATQTLNSTHAHKAEDSFVEMLANLIPFKGALDGVKVEASFDSKTATVKANGQVVEPNVTGLAADTQSFVDAIYSFNNGEYKNKYDALQLEVIEPQPEPLTAEEVLELQRKQVTQTFKQEIAAIKSGYTDEEVESWQSKEREAIIIVNNGTASTPMIDDLASGLGLNRTDYAALIIEKATAYKKAYAAAETKMKIALASL